MDEDYQPFGSRRKRGKVEVDVVSNVERSGGRRRVREAEVRGEGHDVRPRMGVLVGGWILGRRERGRRGGGVVVARGERKRGSNLSLPTLLTAPAEDPKKSRNISSSFGPIWTLFCSRRPREDRKKEGRAQPRVDF